MGSFPIALCYFREVLAILETRDLDGSRDWICKSMQS